LWSFELDRSVDIGIRAALELAKRQRLKAIDVRSLMHERQKFVFDNMSNFTALVVGRRWGKTILCILMLIDTCLKMPDSRCIFIGLVWQDVKDIVWPDIIKFLSDFVNIKYTINLSTLTVYFENGSRLQLASCPDMSTARKFRGDHYDHVIVDEAASMEPYLKELIDVSLKPSMVDHNGKITLIGTPGPTKTGYFYDAFNGGYGFKGLGPWTARDNTKLFEKRVKRGGKPLSPDDFWAECVKNSGGDETHPTFRREWMGEWVDDDRSLVYTFDSLKNSQSFADGIARLKSSSTARTVLGIDTGYEDNCAFVLLAYDSERSDDVWMVHEFVKNHMSFHEIVAHVNDLKKQFRVDITVIDPAHAGKLVMHDLGAKLGMSTMIAQKEQKSEACRLMDSFMREGKLKLDPNSVCVSDMRFLVWKRSSEGVLSPSGGPHSDSLDALLYAWRYCNAHTYKEKVQETELQRQQRLAREMEEQLMKKIQSEQAALRSRIRR
jgi:hypothetical protein